MPLILALKRQRQADLSEFEAGLVYGVSSRTVRAAHRETLSQKTNKESKQQQQQRIKTAAAKSSVC